MYFDDVSKILEIAGRTGCAVFVIPAEIEVKIKNALVLEPEEKSVITIEQVRKITELLATKQFADQYIIIRPADKLGADAANAFLKNLEEPGEKVHYLLITDAPSKILPTILSRSAIYILRRPALLETEFKAEEKVRDLARRLVAAKPSDLPGLAEEITKKKDGVREFALSILGAGVEMLYRSYYVTGKEAFILKIPKFLAAYEAISNNGHIKLHLVADLL